MLMLPLLVCATIITRPAPDGVNTITYEVNDKGIIESQSITTVFVADYRYVPAEGDDVIRTFTENGTNTLYRKINDYASEVIAILPKEPPPEFLPEKELNKPQTDKAKEK